MLQMLLKNSALREWCDKIIYWKLNSLGRAKGCGVDFNQSSLTFKVYVELTEFPNEEIIREFVYPKSLTEKISNLKPFWDSEKKSGLCFGYKLNTEGVHRNYFHIKYKNASSSFEHKKELLFLRFVGIDIDSLSQGLSYEMYLNGETITKHYVYITDPVEIKKVLMYQKISANLDLSEIQELEIYAAPNRHKINIVNKNDFFKIKQKNIHSCIPSQYHNYIREIEKILNTQLVYTGKSSDEIYSAYFSLTNSSDNLLGI